MLDRRPNFFILGAAKCGTTALATWLGEHPNIFISTPKEPWFFNDDFGPNGPFDDLSQYESLYDKANSNHNIIGEASTIYLTSRNAVSNILSHYNNCKFLVMVRNPIDLVISLHNEEVRAFNEDQLSVEHAWHLQDKRNKRVSVPKRCRHPDLLAYKSRAEIGSQLRDLLLQVPAEKLMILFLDDMSSAPAVAYSNVLRFLNVQNYGRRRFKKENTYGTWRFPVMQKGARTLSKLRQKAGLKKSLGVLPLLTKVNKAASVKPSLSREFKTLLVQEFYDEISLVEAITKRDLTAWKII